MKKLLTLLALMASTALLSQRDTSYIIITEIDLVKTQEPGLIIHTKDKYGRSPEQVYIWVNGAYEKTNCVSIKYYIVNNEGIINKNNLFKSN